LVKLLRLVDQPGAPFGVQCVEDLVSVFRIPRLDVQGFQAIEQVLLHIGKLIVDPGQVRKSAETVNMRRTTAGAANDGLKGLLDDLMAHKTHIKVSAGVEHRSRGLKVVFGKFQPI